MLSSQIIFYLLPEDISGMQQWFIENQIVLIKEPVIDLNDRFVTDISLECLERYGGQVLLTLDKWANFSSYKYFKESSWYRVDLNKEFLIQFSISLSDSKELSASRFFFTKQYYNSQSLIKKDEEYVKWAMKVYRDFKKLFLVRYETNPGYINYVTPFALEKYQKKEISFAYN